MPPARNTSRRTCRSPTPRAWRALTRSTLRSLSGYHRGPNYLSHALTAFRCAIGCHRRLARLAPRFFDSAVVDREARERDEHRRWIESWQPLLDKIYGPTRQSEPQASVVSDYPPPCPVRKPAARWSGSWRVATSG